MARRGSKPLFPLSLQALNRGKGLLPEPNLLQLLNNLGPSASLQLLLNPLLHGSAGGKQGKVGPGKVAARVPSALGTRRHCGLFSRPTAE